MKIEQKYEAGSKLASNDLPSSEEVFKSLGIMQGTDYASPFSNIPNIPDPNKNTPPLPPNVAPDKVGVQGTAESQGTNFGGELLGAGKSVAKTAEKVINAPANTWNLMMESAALVNKGMGGTDKGSSSFRDMKAATVDFGLPDPHNDDEQMGYTAAEFTTKFAAITAAAHATKSVVGAAALGGFVNTLLSNPEDPQIISSALKVAGQHFDGSPVFGPMADAITSLGMKLTPSEDANPDQKRLYGMLDSMITDAAVLGATKLSIKAIGTAIEHVPQAAKLLRNERGSIGSGDGGGNGSGEGGGKPPEISGTPPTPGDQVPPTPGDQVPPTPGDQVPPIAQPHEVGAPKDISVRIAADKLGEGVLPEEVRNSIDNINIEELIKKTEGQKNLGPTSKATPVVAAVQKTLESPVTKGFLPPTTNEEILRQAVEVWGNHEKLQAVLNKPVGSAFTEVERAAVQLEVNASSYRLADIAYKIKDANTPENSVEFKKQFEYAVKMKILDTAGASMSGKALAVEQGNFKGTLAGAMDNYLSMSGGQNNISQMASEFRDISSSLGGADKVVAKVAAQASKGATPLEALLEVSKQSMLSGVPTSLKILTSNFVQMGRQQAAINMTAARLYVTKSPMAKAAWDAAAASNEALFTGIFSEAAASLKTSLTTLQEIYKGSYSSRFDIGYRTSPAMSSEALGIKNRMGAEFINLWGGVNRVASSGPILIDKYTDGVAHAQHLNYLAPIKAYEKGLEGDAASAYIDKILAGPVEPRLPSVKSPENLAAYEAQVKEYKDISSVWKEVSDYRDQVKLTQEPTGPLKDVYNVVKTSEPLGLPVLRMLSPFLRSKINLIQDVGSSIGVGRFMSQGNRDILAAGGMQAELLKSRLMLGNTLLTLGATGGFTGAVRGLGSINPEVVRNQKQAGLPMGTVANTLKLDYAGPAGSIVSLGADLGKATQYIGTGIMSKKWETDVIGALQFSVASIGENLLLNDTIIDIVHGLTSGNEADVKTATSQIYSSAGVSLIPGAAALRSVRTEVDPYMRHTDIIKDKNATSMERAVGSAREVVIGLLNQVPGLSKLLPPALDDLGYPMLNTGGIGVARAINEFTPDQIEKNKTLRGMMALGYGNSPVTPVLESNQPLLHIKPMPRDLTLVQGISIPLTHTQRNDMILMSLGKDKPEQKGEVEKRIQEILDSSSTDPVKVIKINTVIGVNRQAAKGLLLQKYPELKQKYNEAASKYVGVLTGDIEKDSIVPGE